MILNLRPLNQGTRKISAQSLKGNLVTLHGCYGTIEMH